MARTDCMQAAAGAAKLGIKNDAKSDVNHVGKRVADNGGNVDNADTVDNAEPSNTGSSIACLEHVRFSYDRGATWLLNDINLHIQRGERVGIVGANGSGKSTLALLLAGLHAPDSGTVTLLGQQVFDGAAHADAYRLARRGIGMVFQNPEDEIITTQVGEDVAFGPENLAFTPTCIDTQVHQALARVGMSASINADPSVMSGGQQQRVALAGILAMDTQLLILDEPSAMLDEDARADLLRTLDALEARGVTMVHITHRLDELEHAQRILHLHDGVLQELQPAATLARFSDAELKALHHAHALANHNNLNNAEQLHAANTDHASHSISQHAATHADLKASENFKASAHDATSPNTTRQAKPTIRLNHVSLRYGRREPFVLHDLSLMVHAGETVAIMGHNGVGKTSLARMITLLQRPSEGTLEVAGAQVSASPERNHGIGAWLERFIHARQRRVAQRTLEQARRRIGYVMQRPERQLFAASVAEDVAYGPRNLGLPPATVDARVAEALRLTHTEHLAQRSPFALSGGQQRLVAIAGVIASHPDIIIFDEPTAGLDFRARAHVEELIKALHQQGKTILIITHQPAVARRLAQRTIIIGNQQIAGAHATRLPSANDDEPRRTAYDADDATTRATTSASTSPMPAASGAPTAKPQHAPAPLTTLDARVKIVGFLAFMLSAFLITKPMQLLVCTLSAAIVLLLARIQPSTLFKQLHMFITMMVLMGLMNIWFVTTGTTLAHWGWLRITDDGLTTAGLYTGRFMLVLLLGAALMLTTRPTELADALRLLLQPGKRFGLHTQDVALILTLALRFLPTLGMETRTIAEAQQARGGGLRVGSLRHKFHAVAAIITPVFAAALRHARNVSLALDARSYESGVERTHWHEAHLRWRDGLFALGCAVAIAALVYYA